MISRFFFSFSLAWWHPSAFGQSEQPFVHCCPHRKILKFFATHPCSPTSSPPISRWREGTIGAIPWLCCCFSSKSRKDHWRLRKLVDCVGCLRTEQLHHEPLFSSSLQLLKYTTWSFDRIVLSVIWNITNALPDLYDGTTHQAYTHQGYPPADPECAKLGGIDFQQLLNEYRSHFCGSWSPQVPSNVEVSLLIRWS